LHGFDWNELLLGRACKLSDPTRLAITIANCMFKSSFTNHLPYLHGEKVFGSMKQHANCPPSENNDSHCHDLREFLLSTINHSYYYAQ
jgi:hypothetical protein